MMSVCWGLSVLREDNWVSILRWWNYWLDCKINWCCLSGRRIDLGKLIEEQREHRGKIRDIALLPSLTMPLSGTLHKQVAASHNYKSHRPHMKHKGGIPLSPTPCWILPTSSTFSSVKGWKQEPLSLTTSASQQRPSKAVGYLRCWQAGWRFERSKTLGTRKLCKT